MMLQHDLEVDSSQAASLCAEGGYFDAAGNVSALGFSPAEASRLAEGHSAGSEAAGQPPQKKARKTPTKSGAPKKDAAEGGPEDTGKVSKETSFQKVPRVLNELSKKVADAQKMVLDCGTSAGAAAPSFIQEIQCGINSMHQQHTLLVTHYKKAIKDPVDYYEPMLANSARQIQWVTDRMDFAKALVAVSKRKEKQGMEANAVASKAKAPAPSPGA